MSQGKPLTSREENWAFAKALLFASPFATWLFWAMAAADPKFTTAGGMVVLLGSASAFTAGLLVCDVIVREWQKWQKYAAAAALIALTAVCGYLAMTAEWLRYPAS